MLLGTTFVTLVIDVYFAVKADLEDLHNITDGKVGLVAQGKFLKEYESETAFCKYFEKFWVLFFAGWCLWNVMAVVCITDNPMESKNAVYKADVKRRR